MYLEALATGLGIARSMTRLWSCSMIFLDCSTYRHYTFYLWKDIIAAYPMARFCLVPLYIYATWSIMVSLRAGGQLELWILGFAACTTLALAPAWLIEFRYFACRIPCLSQV